MNDQILLAQARAITSTLPKLMRKFSVLYDDDPAMNLPLAQLRVCEMLFDGTRAMSALSRDLGISVSAITQITDRLENAGLVERISEPDDRRVKTLQLTSHGMEIINARREKRIARVLNALEELPEEVRTTVVDSFEMLLGEDAVSFSRL